MPNDQENQQRIIELLEKILKELVEIKTNTKITSDFATLRSEIIQRTKGQQVNPQNRGFYSNVQFNFKDGLSLL